MIYNSFTSFFNKDIEDFFLLFNSMGYSLQQGYEALFYF